MYRHLRVQPMLPALSEPRVRKTHTNHSAPVRKKATACATFFVFRLWKRRIDEEDLLAKRATRFSAGGQPLCDTLLTIGMLTSARQSHGIYHIGPMALAYRTFSLSGRCQAALGEEFLF